MRRHHASGDSGAIIARLDWPELLIGFAARLEGRLLHRTCLLRVIFQLSARLANLPGRDLPTSPNAVVLRACRVNSPAILAGNVPGK